MRPRKAIILVQHDGADIDPAKAAIMLEGAPKGEGQLVEVAHDGLRETQRGAEDEGQGGEGAGEVEGAEIEHWCRL